MRSTTSRSDLGTLARLDLVNPDRAEDESYLFKHAVTQEVAYESLPYALRATLHSQVGGFLERQGPEAIERQLDLLAHHYWHSDDEPKKRDYLRRAGDAAQASYANAAAIDYYERLTQLIPDAERVESCSSSARCSSSSVSGIGLASASWKRSSWPRSRRRALRGLVRGGARRDRAQTDALRRGG